MIVWGIVVAESFGDDDDDDACRDDGGLHDDPYCGLNAQDDDDVE